MNIEQAPNSGPPPTSAAPPQTLPVVVEGMETEEQLALLSREACNEVQGPPTRGSGPASKKYGTALEKNLEPLDFKAAWSESPSGPQLDALNVAAVDCGTIGEMPPIFAQEAGSACHRRRFALRPALALSSEASPRLRDIANTGN